MRLLLDTDGATISSLSPGELWDMSSFKARGVLLGVSLFSVTPSSLLGSGRCGIGTSWPVCVTSGQLGGNSCVPLCMGRAGAGGNTDACSACLG